MIQTGDHPTDSAFWTVDDVTGEVQDIDYSTEWPDE